MSKSDSITGLCDIPLPKSAYKQPIELKSAHKKPIELKSAPKQPIELKSAQMQPVVQENQDKQDKEEWCEVRLRYFTS